MKGKIMREWDLGKSCLRPCPAKGNPTKGGFHSYQDNNSKDSNQTRKDS